MRKTAILAGLAMAATLLLAGCPMGDDTQSQPTTRLRNIDIVGARALMTGPSSMATGRAGTPARSEARNEANDPTVLLKQLDDGSWVQVTMWDEYGSEKIQLPADIIDLADDWMAMSFWASSVNGHPVWNNYLVNKLDGRAYDINNLVPGPFFDSWGVNFSPSFQGQPRAYASADGGLFLFLGRERPHSGVMVGAEVWELYLGEIEGTATMITPSEFSVRQFAVDHEGNLLYDIGQFLIARTAAGNNIALNNHPTVQNRQGILFTGRDGIIYFLASESQGTVMTLSQAYRVQITGTTAESVIFTPVSVDGSLSYFGTVFFAFGINSRLHMLQFQDKIVFFNSDSWSGNFSLISWPKTGTPIVSAGGQLGSGGSTTWGPEVTLGAGTIFVLPPPPATGIIEIDPATGAYSTITLPSDVARIERFEVTSNNVIIAEALSVFGNRRLIQRGNGAWETLREDVNMAESITLVRVR